MVRKRTRIAARAAAPDAIDPDADVNFDQFNGADDPSEDIGLAVIRDDVEHASGLSDPVIDAAPIELSSDAPAPRRRVSTAAALQAATRIANEAKRQKLDTAEGLLAFHQFIIDEIVGPGAQSE